jgi:ABC-type sugar transport system permease subunit
VLSRRDRRWAAVVIGAPLAMVIAFVWLPALASVILSLTDWDGVGGLERIHFVGLVNYVDLATAYPGFWPAVTHNLIWIVAYLALATPVGIGLAVLLDHDVRGSAFYQSALYLPVVLSLAIVGFVWELQFSPEQGFVNNVLGRTAPGSVIDWLGDRDLNLWVVLLASSWRHVGLVVVLYLAALKTVDPALRDAAAIDGASAWRVFRSVTFPVLAPMNAVIVVVGTIEALRAFDIVYVINRGLNGLETLATLVANNLLGEASRVGLGSAVATVLLAASVAPILVYLRRTLRWA